MRDHFTCFLWSLVRSLLVEIQCSIYRMECLLDFLVKVIQFIIYNSSISSCISISSPMRLSLRGWVRLSFENVALEVAVFSVGVKCTYKTHMVMWLHIYHDLNLRSLICDVDRGLSGSVSALHYVVAGSIFSGVDHGIH